MAHFAIIDKKTKKVLQVINIDSNKLLLETKQGIIEDENKGIDLLNNLFKNGYLNYKLIELQFVQTSYNEKIRYNYARIGAIYDEINQAFILPKPTINPYKIENKLSIELKGEWILNKQYKWEFIEYSNEEVKNERVGRIDVNTKKEISIMEKYTQSYFKYFFTEKQHWIIILVLIGLQIAILEDTKDLVSLFFLIPIILMIIRSYKMYKEKKNNTTS